MKERPILFRTPMVQAILEGRKTQTRRIVKGLPKKWLEEDGFTPEFVAEPANSLCPYGAIGDYLWVRETLSQTGELGLNYVAGGEWIDETIIPADHIPYRNYACCNVPSIHMPKWAARIWLKVTGCRLERLRDISEEDAISEGVFEYDDDTYYNYFRDKGLRPEDGVECLTARSSFQSLISSIHTKDIWVLNPWCWVISFEVLSLTGRPVILPLELKSVSK